MRVACNRWLAGIVIREKLTISLSKKETLITVEDYNLFSDDRATIVKVV